MLPSPRDDHDLPAAARPVRRLRIVASRPAPPTGTGGRHRKPEPADPSTGGPSRSPVELESAVTDLVPAQLTAPPGERPRLTLSPPTVPPPPLEGRPVHAEDEGDAVTVKVLRPWRPGA